VFLEAAGGIAAMLRCCGDTKEGTKSRKRSHCGI